MSFFKAMLARARSLAGGSESRMEEEFRFHVEMETRRLIETERLDPAEARRRALVAFGGLDAHRESMRDGRGARWFDDLGADFRYAVRVMRRSPGFAAAVALTLGIGIGVNGIVFGYANSLLFRPVPAHDPDRLVGVFSVDTKTGIPSQVGYEDYLDFRNRSGVFDALAGMTGIPLNLVVPGSQSVADMVWGEMVTENYFAVLGMRSAAGRLFDESDGPQGSNPVAVLSYDSWMKRFGGDSSIVGKRIRINGSEFTVTGVAARGFKGMRTFGFWPEIWVPMGMHAVALPGSTQFLTGRGGGNLMLVGRLRDGAAIERTGREASQFAAQLSQAYPASNATTGVILTPGRSGFDNPAFVKPSVLVLVSALGVFAAFLTLVIICANLANLQLARASARVHEVAIRLSLGCSRARLTRQMVVESAVLAIPGIIIAAALLPLAGPLETMLTPRLQFRVGFLAGPDARVIALTAVVGFMAVFMFGLIPALKASASRSLSGLIGARRSSSQPHRLRSVLVVSQLAMSVVLLVGATLFARNLLRARAVDVGFDPTNRVLMSVNLGLQGYDEARGRAFYDQVIARVRTNPSVVAASWGFPVPFDTYGRSVSLYVEGAATANEDGTVDVEASSMAEGFIEALGLRREAGRGFTVGDSAGVPRVMIVSRQLANRLWPGKDPVGQRARINGAGGQEITVVGVVSDAKFTGIGERSRARMYIPSRQRYRDWMTLIVHTRGDPAAAIPELKRIVTAADPTLPVFGVSSMTQSVESGHATSRSAAGVAGVFGAIALIISSIGLYAVVASGVSERTREIGVRMALGSTPPDVMRFVMRGGARLGLIGLAIGLVAAVAVSRLMGGLLQGLSSADPVTFAGVPLVLALIVLIATYVPARRAVRLDPVTALRSE